MPRRIRDHRIETRSSRLKLDYRHEPYFKKIDRGLYVGYRRCKGNGTFSMRVLDERGRDLYRQVLGPADDFEGVKDSMSFHQAVARARELVHGSTRDPGKPITVIEAVNDYKAYLELHDGDVSNATRIAGHLDGHPLAHKAVSTLDAHTLERFKADLKRKLKSAGAVVRNSKSLGAALRLAAARDPLRIRNTEAFKLGLKPLPGSTQARRLVLKDEVIQRLMAAAPEEGPAFALKLTVCATTGARPSQIDRLIVDDLLHNQHRLLVPRARKGANRAKTVRETRPVPISPTLAMRLHVAAGDRDGHDPLLLMDDRRSWRSPGGKDLFGRAFARTVTRAGLDPKKITSYALRHSSVVRMLLKKVPIAVVADHHDTGVRQLRDHYAKYISEYTDDLTRATLLPDVEDSTDNVVVLR